jgi:hypothetical protein
MASAEREPILEVWGLPPVWSRDKAPGSGEGAFALEADKISAIQTLIMP